jgi:NADH:ubiquinone oxidoreductase subunit 4 (subunit M)
MGTYGLLRVSYSILPEATKWFAPYLLIIAFINIVYGAFCAMSQRDMKRMVAYSSVNHMGYCLLGMAAITGTNAAAGLSGAGHADGDPRDHHREPLPFGGRHL